MKRATYQILSSGMISRLFSINKQNEFTFKIGTWKGISVNSIYQSHPDLLIECLDNLFHYYETNLVDKMNIISICKELKIQNYYEL